MHALPVRMLVISGHTAFLPQSKDMLVRWTDQSKVTIGVSVNDFLSLC